MSTSASNRTIATIIIRRTKKKSHENETQPSPAKRPRIPSLASDFSITSFVLSDGIIPTGAFEFCTKITSVIIPCGIKTIGGGSFQYCWNLTSLILPDDGLNYIGPVAFASCSRLTSLTLPNGLTTIEGYAFSECVSLTSVSLPHSLTNIGPCAFIECPVLSSVLFRRPVYRAGFITWAVGSSRHRKNYQVTTLKHTCNVLRLITLMALRCRNVTSVDPDGILEVFRSCPRLKKYPVPE